MVRSQLRCAHSKCEGHAWRSSSGDRPDGYGGSSMGGSRPSNSCRKGLATVKKAIDDQHSVFNIVCCGLFIQKHLSTLTPMSGLSAQAPADCRTNEPTAQWRLAFNSPVVKNLDGTSRIYSNRVMLGWLTRLGTHARLDGEGGPAELGLYVALEITPAACTHAHHPAP